MRHRPAHHHGTWPTGDLLFRICCSVLLLLLPSAVLVAGARLGAHMCVGRPGARPIQHNAHVTGRARTALPNSLERYMHRMAICRPSNPASSNGEQPTHLVARAQSADREHAERWRAYRYCPYRSVCVTGRPSHVWAWRGELCGHGACVGMAWRAWRAVHRGKKQNPGRATPTANSGIAACGFSNPLRLSERKKRSHSPAWPPYKLQSPPVNS